MRITRGLAERMIEAGAKALYDDMSNGQAITPPWKQAGRPVRTVYRRLACLVLAAVAELASESHE
jgi:hypothetical protein